MTYKKKREGAVPRDRERRKKKNSDDAEELTRKGGEKDIFALLEKGCNLRNKDHWRFRREREKYR